MINPVLSAERQKQLTEFKAGRFSFDFRGVKHLSEDWHQANFFTWIDQYIEEYPILQTVFAIPNGSHKSKTQRYVMQLTGLRSGVPDVFCSVSSRSIHGPSKIVVDYHGLYIEFKKDTKNKPSPNQQIWIKRLREQEYRVEVCYTWQMAVNLLIDHLHLPLRDLETP